MLKLFLQNVLEICIQTFEPDEINFYQYALPYQDLYDQELNKNKLAVLVAKNSPKEGLTLRLLDRLMNSVKRDQNKKSDTAQYLWLQDLSVIIERIKSLDKHLDAIENKKSEWLLALSKGTDAQQIQQRVDLFNTEIEKLLLSEDRDYPGIYPLLKKSEAYVNQRAANKSERDKLSLLLTSYPTSKLLSEAKALIEGMAETISTTIKMRTAEAARMSQMNQATAAMQSLQTLLQNLAKIQKDELDNAAQLTQALLETKEKQLTQMTVIWRKAQQASDDQQQHSRLMILHLHRENDQLVEQVNDLRSQQEILNQKITVLDAQDKEKTAQNTKDKAMIQALNLRVTTFSAQIKALEVKGNEQLTKIQQDEQTIADLTRQAEQAQQQIQALKTEIQSLQSQLQQIEKIKTDLVKNNEQAQQRITQLEQTGNAAQEKIQKLSSDNSQLQQEKTQAQQENLAAEAAAKAHIQALELQLMEQKGKTSEVLRKAFCMDFSADSDAFKTRKEQYVSKFGDAIRALAQESALPKVATPERMPATQRKELYDDLIALAQNEEKRNDYIPALLNYLHAYKHASNEIKATRVFVLFSASKQLSEKEVVYQSFIRVFNLYLKNKEKNLHSPVCIDLLTQMPATIDPFFDLDLYPEDLFEIFESLLAQLENTTDSALFETAKKYYYWVIDTLAPYYIEDLQAISSIDDARLYFKESEIISDYILSLDKFFTQLQQSRAEAKQATQKQPVKKVPSNLRPVETAVSNIAKQPLSVSRQIKFDQEDKSTAITTIAPTTNTIIATTSNPPAFLPPPLLPPPPAANIASATTTLLPPVWSVAANPLLPNASLPPAPSAPLVKPINSTAVVATTSSTVQTSALLPQELATNATVTATTTPDEQEQDQSEAALPTNSLLAAIRAGGKVPSRTQFVSPSKRPKELPPKSQFVSAFEERMNSVQAILSQRRAAIEPDSKKQDHTDDDWEETNVPTTKQRRQSIIPAGRKGPK